MQEKTGKITTFTTAGGDLAVHGRTSGDKFKMLTYMISQRLGESSRRVYLHTYSRWYDFAERNGLDTLDLS